MKNAAQQQTTAANAMMVRQNKVSCLKVFPGQILWQNKSTSGHFIVIRYTFAPRNSLHRGRRERHFYVDDNTLHVQSAVCLDCRRLLGRGDYSRPIGLFWASLQESIVRCGLCVVHALMSTSRCGKFGDVRSLRCLDISVPGHFSPWAGLVCRILAGGCSVLVGTGVIGRTAWLFAVYISQIRIWCSFCHARQYMLSLCPSMQCGCSILAAEWLDSSAVGIAQIIAHTAIESILCRVREEWQWVLPRWLWGGLVILLTIV